MGKTFEIDMADPNTFEIDMGQPEPQMGFGRGVLDQVLGTGETALAMGSGALGSAVGGLVGATNLPFRGMDYARQQSDAYRNALTYEPRTRSGRAAVDLASLPAGWLAGQAQNASDATYEASGSPGLATEVNVGLNALPAMAARGLKGPVGGMLERRANKLGGEKSAHSVELETMDLAKKEGFQVNPTLSNAKRQDINQQAANRIARREAGLGENEPITRDNLKSARAEISQPYREVSSISPRAKTAVRDLEQARYDANRQYEFYRASRNPEVQDKARAFEREADRLELIVEHEAKSAGRSDLIPKLKQARTDLAKNHDVEAALNTGNGNVDVTVWGRMLDHGRPLSGGLETAARFEQATRGAIASGGVGVGQGGTTIPLSKMGLAASAFNAASRLKRPKSYKESFSLSDLATRRPELYLLGQPEDQQ